jgi:hypothetical protein
VKTAHPWPRQPWPGVVAAKVRPAGQAVAPPGDRGRRGAAAAWRLDEASIRSTPGWRSTRRGLRPLRDTAAPHTDSRAAANAAGKPEAQAEGIRVALPDHVPHSLGSRLGLQGHRSIRRHTPRSHPSPNASPTIDGQIPRYRGHNSGARPGGPGQFRRAKARKAKIARCDVLPITRHRRSGGHNATLRRGEGLPVPREPGYGSKRSQDGEAQRTCSERQAGCLTRTSGDGAWAAHRRGHLQSTVTDRHSGAIRLQDRPTGARAKKVSWMAWLAPFKRP